MNGRPSSEILASLLAFTLFVMATPSVARTAEIAAATTSVETLGTLDRIEKLLSSPAARFSTESPPWKELEEFHQELWRTMALDPIPHVVVRGISSEELTHRLESRLAGLLSAPM